MPRVFFFQVPLFSPDVINLCPLHVINLTVLYLMLLLCVWSHLLFVGALSSPSLGSQKATAATPAFAGSLLLFHLIAADSV